MIEREPRSLRPPRPHNRGWPDADQETQADVDSLLEPGAIREQFSMARKEVARPRRWLGDLVGHGHGHSRAASVEPPAENGHERELRALARRDETLREWEQWIAGRREELQRRLDELAAVEQSLELREREVLRREEAAARWFAELNRTHRLIEEKLHRLEPERRR